MAIQINDTSSMVHNYHLNDAKETASKALKNIAAVREDNGNSANIAIADAMLADAHATRQGVANANDAVGMLQIADGALQTLSEGSDRLNELSVAMNNAALGREGRAALMNEANALIGSMQDSIANATFGDQNVFGGMANFTTGLGSTTSINLSAPNFSNLDITNQSSISSFADSVNSLRTTIGSTQNGLMSDINASVQSEISTLSSASEMTESDVAEQVANFARANEQTNAAILSGAHNNQILQNQIAALLG